MRPIILLLASCLLLGCARGSGAPGLDGVIELDQAGLGAEVGGRVLRVLVACGDQVRKGQVLAELDDALERAQRPIREAELRAAEERLRLAEVGARGSEVRSLDAQLQAAGTQVEGAERDLNRQTQLLQRGAGTQALVDDLRTRRDRALAERDAAAQRLSTLRSGARPQEIRAAAAARDAARAVLQALDERLTRYRVTAPADGLIIDVIARPGEVLPPGAVALLFAQPEIPYVDVFVPVPALAPLRVGQPATVHPDGDARAYPARIEQIAPTTEYTPRYLLSEADRKQLVTRVRVRINDAQRALHGGAPCRVLLGAAEGPR